MARTWNGLDLQTRFSQLLGDEGDTFKTRVMEWINDIILDISARHDWQSLKVQGRKLVMPGEFEQELELPQPNAPTVAISSGGSLTESSVYKVLITHFEKKTGAESIAGKESASVTATSVNKTITLTDIPRSIHPLVTSRKIYLIKDSGNPLFVKELFDNTTVTTTIDVESSSLIQPPDREYMKTLSGHPRETNQRYLRHRPKDQMMLERDGTPNEGSLTSYDYLESSRLFLEPRPFGFDTQTQDYSDSSVFTFDSDEVTISGGQACLADQTPTDAKFGASYTTDEDLVNWSSCPFDGTLVGGATVASGKLNLKGLTGKYCTYDATGAINPTRGTIRIRYIPNYTGNPAADKVLWNFQASSGSNVNRLQLKQDSSSAFRLDTYDSSGTLVSSNVGFSTKVFTAGVEYEIEFNYDFSSAVAEQRLFVDGVQFGTTRTLTFTRDDNLTSITYLQIGDTVDSDAEYNEIVGYDVVQHTAAYTAPTASIPESLYKINAPALYISDNLTATFLDDVAVTVTEPTNTQVKYGLRIDDVTKYWDGTHWATSDLSSSQFNDLGTLNENIDSFIDKATSQVQLHVALTSTDGANTPCISNHVFSYKQSTQEVEFDYFRVPREIFAASDSVPQISPMLKEVLEAGVEYKGYKYRDRDGTPGKFQTYQALLNQMISEIGLRARVRQRVRDVVGDADAETLT